jgi:hypothetical protein
MHRLLMVAALLGLTGSAPALAQTKYQFNGPTPVTASATPSSTATTAKAPFGCEARKPGICYFRVYYARGSREVVLPAGMKQAIPEVRIGSDSYCMAVNAKPAPKCTRKTINASYNS